MKERNKSDKPKNNQQTKSSIIGERNSHFSDKKVKIASWKSNYTDGEDVGLQVLYAKSLPR